MQSSPPDRSLLAPKQIGLPGIEDLAAALRLAPFGRRAEGERAVDGPVVDTDHSGDVSLVGTDRGEGPDALVARDPRHVTPQALRFRALQPRGASYPRTRCEIRRG
jgi:hypothetical protein